MWNFCVKLLRKTSKEFQNNINVKYITESKLFWETVKALFTGKTLKDEDITLILTIHLCQLKVNYLKFPTSILELTFKTEG